MTQRTASTDAYAARRAALFARTTTDTLITSLRTIVAQQNTDPSRELNKTRSWIIDELERRYPAADAAVQTAFDQADATQQETGEVVEVDYVAVLIDAIRTTKS